MHRPPALGIHNWRDFPFSQWSFQHVNEIVPSAVIQIGNSSFEDPYATLGLDQCSELTMDGYTDLADFLQKTHTDGFIVSHNGKPVANWYAGHFKANHPHLLFSVSKSITATVAGILQHKGMLDVNAPVGDYLDVSSSSAYFDCTVQHVLDMSVALDFEEDYTKSATGYVKYRQASGWNPVDQNNENEGLRRFITTLKKNNDDHGKVFRYRSPNTDLLGMILASAGGSSFSSLMEQYLWKPMNARSLAFVTVDHHGDARTAGGICTTLGDLSMLGQLICDNGVNNSGQQILSTSWIEEIMHGGSSATWQSGDFAYIFPEGGYRNKWYQYGNADNAICAMGIHGQYLYINPTRNIVISRVASQPLPVNETIEPSVLKIMQDIAQHYK